MENTVRIIDCVEFKNDLHKKLYIKSGANNFRGHSAIPSAIPRIPHKAF
jgi:hypothetical protein